MQTQRWYECTFEYSKWKVQKCYQIYRFSLGRRAWVVFTDALMQKNKIQQEGERNEEGEDGRKGEKNRESGEVTVPYLSHDKV